MSTHRQQILDNIAARLLLIRPGVVFQLLDGSYTCLTAVNKVQTWRKNPYSLIELPAIAWRDQVTKLSSVEFRNAYIYKLRCVFAAYLKGQGASSQARDILGDMLAAVGSDPRCGGLARKTEINKTSLMLGQQAEIVAGARLDITVTYYPANPAEEPVSENVLTAAGETITAGGETIEW